MALPELVKRSVETKLQRYCEQKVPSDVPLRILYTLRGNSVTIIESRPHYCENDRWVEVPVAQFRFSPEQRLWSLYWADRNLRWHPYEGLDPDPKIETLLQEIDRDPTCIFWG
ncbi:DUF3024 domain-containing protein [Geomesophilobacter sediminis]|uniref:DUF3024 domain-containing protein n=1 Tax=Geomesophilobacter sediminis TaxID=2798584 RepID=A0A8J7LV57_9BACT|nr:DUF3024 domain-containing protein [Geomesophilobacter sediminis]MBJ6724570.1 DUF3024 domain-containing protein [Geomesophilobacter sediminis]